MSGFDRRTIRYSIMYGGVSGMAFNFSQKIMFDRYKSYPIRCFHKRKHFCLMEPFKKLK